MLTATSTSGASQGGAPDSTGTGAASVGEDGPTCRDVIDCVVGCSAEMQQDTADVDVDACKVQCESGVSIDHVLSLFQLTECVTDKCIEQGACGETSTSVGSSGTSTGEPGTSTGEPGTSESSGGPPGSTSPCTDCILANLLDRNPGGECQALADLCV
jgi:hypothetical protein